MSLIVGNCLFNFVQECHIHDFFMKRCSGRVKVKLNLNTTPSFSENSISSCYGISNSVQLCLSDDLSFVVLIGSVQFPSSVLVVV